MPKGFMIVHHIFFIILPETLMIAINCFDVDFEILFSIIRSSKTQGKQIFIT